MVGDSGEVKINWKTLTMSFCRGGKQVHIRGEPKLARMLVTPKALKKEKEIEAVSLVWGIENAEHSVSDQSRNNQFRRFNNKQQSWRTS